MRLFTIALAFLFSLTFTSSAWADQLLIEPDMGRAPILQAINNTRYTLDVVMYGLTDATLLDAITQQQKIGRTVKVILEAQPYKNESENSQAIDTLKSKLVAWQGTIAPFRLIHQKTLLIDDKQAIVMTFNFTHSTFDKERNFALIIDDPVKVHEIAAVFNADWNHTPSTQHSADLIYSPDDSRAKFIDLISAANNTIKIYQQSVSDYKIVGALAKAARKGVNVEILTSNNMRQKQADYLKRAGVRIKLSQQYYIHAKVLLIDNQEAVIGSINFTQASFDKNRELSVITHDRNVIKPLAETFDHDWEASNGEAVKISSHSKKSYYNKSPHLSRAQQRKILRTARWIKKYLRHVQANAA